MLKRLLPRDSNFFDLFDKQINYAIEAASHFRETVGRGAVDDVSLQRMHDIEHLGDGIAHDIIERLNKTFITPFDREDIHTLTVQIDDIIDMIYTIMNRVKVYKVDRPDKNLIEFAAVIHQSVQSVGRAVNGMRDLKHSKIITDACVEVNRLENVGDAMRDDTLGELLDGAHDPIYVIKWKEIYQDAETVLDICEDVAHVVSSILVKHT